MSRPYRLSASLRSKEMSLRLAVCGAALLAVFAPPAVAAVVTVVDVAQNQAAVPELPVIKFCGQEAAAPRAQPPAGSGPVVLAYGPCFEAQGGTSVIEPQTYLYYIQLKQSRPSEGVWIPYDETTEKTLLQDFKS